MTDDFFDSNFDKQITNQRQLDDWRGAYYGSSTYRLDIDDLKFLMKSPDNHLGFVINDEYSSTVKLTGRAIKWLRKMEAMRKNG